MHRWPRDPTQASTAVVLLAGVLLLSGVAVALGVGLVGGQFAGPGALQEEPGGEAGVTDAAADDDEERRSLFATTEAEAVFLANPTDVPVTVNATAEDGAAGGEDGAAGAEDGATVETVALAAGATTTTTLEAGTYELAAQTEDGDAVEVNGRENWTVTLREERQSLTVSIEEHTATIENPNDVGVAVAFERDDEHVTAIVVPGNATVSERLGAGNYTVSAQALKGDPVQVDGETASELTLGSEADEDEPEPDASDADAETDGDDGGENGGDDVDPAEFDVSDLEPETASITYGDTFDVSATVENVGGEEGEQSVELRIDDEIEDERDVELDGGESTDVTFSNVSTDDLDPGEYEHGVFTANDSETGSLTVEERSGPPPGEPAEFVVSELDPADAEVPLGDPIDVSAAVENVGDEEGNQTVELRMDDEAVETRNVTLDGGDATAVAFDAVDTGHLEAGGVEHGVFTENDSATGTLTIVDDYYDCDDFDSWEDAQEVHDRSGGAHGLDGDGDGTACESFPGAPGDGEDPGDGEAPGDGDYTCDDFDSWEEANDVFEDSGGEYGLDGDGDGVPCESRPGAPDDDDETDGDDGGASETDDGEAAA